jgi:hypothetical protein
MKIKKLFLDNYLANANANIDNEVFDRINYYYHWTAMRTASFFLTKNGPEPERADILIKEVAKKMKW